MKKALLFLLCTAVLSLLCSCKREVVIESQPVPEETAQTETVPETKPEIVIQDEPKETAAPEEKDEKVLEHRVHDGLFDSYLTGEEVPAEIGLRRPLAIMMSNDRESCPQYGINHAGVIYEAPVEASIVRYMSLIEDYDDLERIGSVRSCRTYYTYFAREWDAVYAHFGQSTFALPYLDNVDNINGIDGIGSTAFYRSSDRKSPHNAYSSGKKIKEAIEKLKYRTAYSKDYNGHFLFRKEEYSLDEGSSMEAYKIKPGYVLNKPWFEFSEEDGLYHRYQYGEEHCGNEGPLAVKNVIFQYSPASTYATTQYLNINLHEPTYGYYFTNGRCIPVSVKKDGEFGVTHYYDPENHEINLNKGKTWICIIRAQDFNNTEIYDANGEKSF